MEWFKDWFDTPYYSLLYEKRDHSEAEHFIKNSLAYLGLKPGQRVLDLPCGRGRHAFFLRASGLKVVGADLSERSIEVAKKHEDTGLHFFVHDIRNPLNERYDAVFNLFTSLGYFKSRAEDRKALHHLAGAVAEGGHLLIDFMNAKRVIAELVPDEVVQRAGLRFHLSRRIQEGFIEKTIRFEDRGRSHHYEERVRLLRYEDFRAGLEATGLHIQQCSGNYDLAPFDEQTSDRLIIIAKR